jgi:hypothetical protein
MNQTGGDVRGRGESNSLVLCHLSACRADARRVGQPEGGDSNIEHEHVALDAMI